VCYSDKKRYLALKLLLEPSPKNVSGPESKNIQNMEPYEGVKEASEYLKSQGVPREYRKQILESFDRRTIRIEIAGDSTFGIRFYGGNSNAKGRYLFETFNA